VPGQLGESLRFIEVGEGGGEGFETETIILGVSYDLASLVLRRRVAAVGISIKSIGSMLKLYKRRVEDNRTASLMILEWRWLRGLRATGV